MTLKMRGGIPTSTPTHNESSARKLSFTLTLTRRVRVPLFPQGRGNFLSCRIYTKLSSHTPNCHAELILNCHAELFSASLLQPAESRLRRHLYKSLHGFHPHPAYASSLSPQGRGGMSKPHPQRKPRSGAFVCSHPHPTLVRPPLPSREREFLVMPNLHPLPSREREFLVMPNLHQTVPPHQIVMPNLFRHLFFGRPKTGHATSLTREAPISGLSAFSPSPDAYASPLSPQGRGACRKTQHPTHKESLLNSHPHPTLTRPPLPSREREFFVMPN